MGWKAMEITLIINNAFSPKTAKNVQCRDGSSFAKETESLDDEEPAEMVGHRKLTVTN